jgi:hypothetical protein
MKKLLLVLVMIALCVPFGMQAKKSKENKKQMTLLERIESIKWDSPTRQEGSNYASLNLMYNYADSFYTMIQAMPDSVPLYEIRKVYNSTTGDTILAPVNIRTNELAPSKRAAAQSLDGLNYVLNITLWTEKLAASLIENSVQIAVDATPLGNKERKNANKQIAGFCKIYPTICSAIKQQSRLMTEYKKQNESLSQDAGPVTSMPGEDLTSDVVMNMSDEEISAWLEEEQASRS